MVKLDERFNPQEVFDLEFPATDQPSIYFSKFDGYYEITPTRNSKPVLEGINLSVPKGELLGITGKVGSGKSALLGVILEEMPTYRGIYASHGSVAYVEQEPLILSGTIKENVLFRSQSFDQQKYKLALRDTCLAEDILLFPEGEEGTVLQKPCVRFKNSAKRKLT